MKTVRQLQDNRDMSINECKLTIAIEDPRSRERREALGIEVSTQSENQLPAKSWKPTKFAFCLFMFVAPSSNNEVSSQNMGFLFMAICTMDRCCTLCLML